MSSRRPPSRPRAAQARGPGRTRTRGREAARQVYERRQRRQRRLRRVLRVGPAAVLAVVLVTVGAWADAGPVHRTIPDDHPVRAYRITYTDDLSGVHTEEIEAVAKPYVGARLTRKDGRLSTGDVTDDDGLWVFTTGTTPGWLHGGGGHQHAFGDYAVGAVLRRAVALGLARVVATDTVLGRRCTVVRTGAPLGEGFKKPTADEHADLWVDATGVVLRMEWYYVGKHVQHLVATSFQIGPGPTPAELQHTPQLSTPGIARLAGVATKLTDAQRAALTGHVDVPPGYRYDGGEIRFRNIVGTSTAAVTVEHYVDDQGNLVDVEHTDAAAAPGKGMPVDVGGGHTGYVTLELGTSLLSIDVSSSSVLTIRADDPAVLAAVARTYRA